MWATGTMYEQHYPLRVINPLRVSLNSSAKKHLIFDLGYVNMHHYKDKIKFDDWKFFANYLLANKGYLFKFCLKKVYRINIFDYH